MGRWVVAVRAGEAAVSAKEPRYVCIDQKCKKLGTPGLQHVTDGVTRPPRTATLGRRAPARAPMAPRRLPQAARKTARVTQLLMAVR